MSLWEIKKLFYWQVSKAVTGCINSAVLIIVYLSCIYQSTLHSVILQSAIFMMSSSNLSLSTVLEEYGKLLYIIHPGRNCFPRLEGVPDYVQQAMPYMVTLILLEAGAALNLFFCKH